MNKYFVLRESCPACKSIKYSEICKISFTESPVYDYLTNYYSEQGKIEFEYLKGSHYVLIRCLDCGLVYQKEIPNEFLMSKIYEEWINPEKSYKKSIKKNQDIDYCISLTIEIINIIKYFGTTKLIKVLDFAMGWAHYALRAKWLGLDVYGCEISELRKRNATQLGIKMIDPAKIKRNSFQFINAFAIFEHISQPLETLTYLKTALSPGGIIKIYVPNGFDINRRLKIWDWKAVKGSRNSLNPVSPLEHINCFNHKNLTNMAKLAGLEPINIPNRLPFSFKKMIKLTLQPYYQLFKPRKPTLLFFKKSIRK